MNRRQFFLGMGWSFQERPATLEVEVMEVFSASSGPSAFLVHHTSEATRNAFIEWLRTNNGTPVVCRLRDGTRLDGRIFRVGLCFGRGLILTREPAAIRARDVLSIN
jgi:hypothetical protein